MRIEGRNGALILSGRLIKDAEKKVVGSKAMCRTSLVIAENREDPLTSAVAWYELGEECARFKKGDRVLVAGRLQSREYNGRTYEDLILDFAIKQSVGSQHADADAATDGYADVSADDCPFF